MKIKGNLPIDRETTIQKILDSPIPYEDEKSESETDIKDLLAKLSPEEVEIAAQTSYAYWLATLSDKPPTDAEREKFAMRECRRTLFKNKPKKAFTLIKGTVEIRKEKRVDLIRSCFLENVEYDNEEDKQMAKELRDMIADDMSKQISVVRGHDNGGLAILTIFSRTALGKSGDAYLALILYAMERAAATTEHISLGAKEKITVVLDFGSFDSSVAPSWGDNKAVAMVLQHHYPERLKRLVILDPPFWIRTMYNMVSPFLDPLTKKKFVVCSGEKQKTKALSEVVEADQAMPFMRPDGQLTDEVDVGRYLNSVPFHKSYE